MVDGKKLIILGDRDGIPSGAVEACFADKNVEIVFSATECYV